ncbi:septation protein SepH [Allosalinactinospora lopnorensis]|uniref:septation protein SepH n=1 Tax=Allosalinactinospora lopnorensis TaxID=1352348 RepID=UPI000623DBBF|nr:septation protein SepH [Allosalinactinospora lopnorensis]
MQELRLVAVSEDGTYLVLASAGRGTRFMLPVDDRLRAAVRGQFSRLGQYEIEVENPLRPKEIQARIRSGETAEAISEYSGIPIERVRWFESPVLQEREYMAQQAQRASVRRQGESSPGPTLGDLVNERIGPHQLETGDAVWDAWKREDNTWQLRLAFQVADEERVAHWRYEPRRRCVTPADEEAVRLCTPEAAEPLDLGPGSANVTPFVPRRQGGAAESAPPRTDPVAPPESPLSSAATEQSPSTTPLKPAAPPEKPAAPGRVSVTSERTAPAPAGQESAATTAPQRRPTGKPHEPAPADDAPEPPARPQSPAAEGPSGERPEPEAPETPAAQHSAPPAAPRSKERSERQGRQERSRQEAPVSAAAAGGTTGGAQTPKRKGRGRRASVPSWDEIMFGSKKPD